MSVTAPDWLSKRGGALRAGTTGNAWLVVLDDTPQYRLVPTPAAGKFGCEVLRTVDGRRLDAGGTFSTNDEAVQGGLEDLRKSLGW
jgi:hypothetical protein